MNQINAHLNQNHFLASDKFIGSDDRQQSVCIKYQLTEQNNKHSEICVLHVENILFFSICNLFLEALLLVRLVCNGVRQLSVRS